MRTDYSRHAPREAQFGLLSLLGFVTVCAIISAAAGVISLPASVFLMLMALALWARQGVPALAMLMAALVSADATLRSHDEGMSLIRQVAILATAAFLGGWYCLRRRRV
jgi:hypothetical protein